MGCVTSSPHSRRRYRDPADLDEEYVDGDTLNRRVRTFGQFRSGSGVHVPDDIDGLPSTQLLGPSLATDPDLLLYEGEIDNGRAWRCIRPMIALWIFPPVWAAAAAKGLSYVFSTCTCDEAACWVRKEYSTRVFYRVYPNRIEINNPLVRIPFGCFGCGSWNADVIASHPFDRGAFGFRRIQAGVINKVCGIWPLYGDIVARQRCPCNGPLWAGGRGWWCDEWLCDVCFCTYRYFGLADGDEVSFASGIALQAYFEGRQITKADMDKCIEYWRNNISQSHDPVGRKRDVMCEPYCIPCCHGTYFYKFFCNCDRKIPYKDHKERTKELKAAYKRYKDLREKQIHHYETFKGPVYHDTVCKSLGCRRVFGRGGLIFCTEGLYDSETGWCYNKLKVGGDDPFPPFKDSDFDDDNDASKVLAKVLGRPPSNVVYKRWERNDKNGNYEIVTYPNLAEDYSDGNSNDVEKGAVSSQQETGDVLAVACSSGGDKMGSSAIIPPANSLTLSAGLMADSNEKPTLQETLSEEGEA